MDESSLARAGTCPTHGLVNSLPAGPRLKCPECGLFLKKQETTALAIVRHPTAGGVDQVLERIKIREFVRAARRKLAEAESDGRGDFVDYHVAREHLSFLEAQCMELPMGDLDRVVKSALAEASWVLGTARIFEEISSFVEQRDALYAEVKELRGLKNQVQEEVNRLNASVRSIERQLLEAEKQTGLPHWEILQCLQDFKNLRAAVGHLTYQRDQLAAACQQAQAYLWRLQGDVERTKADLKRLKGIRQEEFNGLANRLTTRDLYALMDANIRRKNQQVLLELRQTVAASTRFLTAPTYCIVTPAVGANGSVVPAPLHPRSPANETVTLEKNAGTLTTKDTDPQSGK